MIGRRNSIREADCAIHEAVFREIIRVADRVAAGDHGTRVAPVSGEDGSELAAAARQAVNRLLDGADARVAGSTGAAQQLRTEVSDAAHAMDADRRARRAFADEFEKAVMPIAQQVAASAGQLSASAADLAETAAAAGREADRATGTVSTLQDSSREIQQVVALIVQIAAQTKLLALNATIEAARAGAAGQGFAVVAEEVKSLADETSRAAEQVTTQVNAVQAVSGSSTQVMQGIGATVEQMAGMVDAIGTAVGGSSGSGSGFGPGHGGSPGSPGLSELAEALRAEVSRFLITLRE